MVLTGGHVILVYLIMTGAFGTCMLMFLVEFTYWNLTSSLGKMRIKRALRKHIKEKAPYMH